MRRFLSGCNEKLNLPYTTHLLLALFVSPSFSFESLLYSQFSLHLTQFCNLYSAPIPTFPPFSITIPLFPLHSFLFIPRSLYIHAFFPLHFPFSPGLFHTLSLPPCNLLSQREFLQKIQIATLLNCQFFSFLFIPKYNNEGHSQLLSECKFIT